ncbi:hypothetical protein EDB81DRAFT_835178 [Dactylonectria macrodidyma]|uniref:F-box domain-containing protein n=1 Tax=Dactylonectria macrodidyma TaxID=307937 RepID=A0A9P9I5W5_9HYPO|nr:hypothetical protein EDB81DRAFT_835178 [Dactylonectria macrodidyma]
MTTVSLLQLPNELIHMICTTLCSHCMGDWEIEYQPNSKGALSRLARTSRRIHDIVMPVLYHTLFETMPQIFPDSPLLGKLFTFMRSISRNPKLICHVKQAAFTLYTRPSVYDIPIVDTLTERLDSSFLHDWATIIFNERAADLRADTALYHGLLLDVFFSSAINLDRLSLECSSMRQFRKFIPSSSVLESLKTLHLVHRSTSGGFDLGAVAELLEISPNIEHLYADMCYSAPAELNLTYLKHLRFSSCSFGSGDLRNVVLACQNLRSFAFQYFQPASSIYELYRNDFSPSPKRIVEELKVCESTLEYLEIELAQGIPFTEFNSEHTITSLRNFSALKDVVVDEVSLHSDERSLLDEVPDNGTEATIGKLGKTLMRILPTSIESVNLKSVGPCFTRYTGQVVNEACRSFFPNFKTLLVSTPGETSGAELCIAKD